MATATATGVHLAFDMGIRNLAYCLISHGSSDGSRVLAWDNVDLLEGGTSAQTAKQCVGCRMAARWMGPDGTKWCQACATGVRRRKDAVGRPVHPTWSGGALTVKALRAAAGAEGAPGAGSIDSKKAKKDELTAWAAAHFLLPWTPAKAMKTSLTDICKAMDSWLDTLLPTFASATLIRLENQPVMKGPTMKSVQMILFTLLTHRLSREHGWAGRIEFVHAGNKTRGVPAAEEPPAPAAGGAGARDDGAAYRARKKTAESEVLDALEKGGAHMASWLAFFNSRSKKSDLADAFLMAAAPVRSST
jgi:hypothetical protein